MRTVSVATLGCKTNQCESESLLGALERRGYVPVPFGQESDITIINTCTVTHRADFQSRQIIRRALRANPNSLIIVTGCYAQVDPGAISKIEGVRYVLGNKGKNTIADLLPRMEKGGLPRIHVAGIEGEKDFSDILPSFRHHTRAFLKIQDGCDGQCSYCIVPRARGRGRSLAPERVIQHMRALKECGFKEVVLTGIHAGSYGQDLDPPFSLEKLLRRLEEEETPHRLRLSSVEPFDFTPALISCLTESKKLCPHLHIPVQSGDDEILERMNRRYNSHSISHLFTQLHQAIPDISIGTDVIVGFPGETEESFRRTYELIDSLPISYLHVFPFSKRIGTPASGLSRHVEQGTVKRRAEQLRELGKRKRFSFYRRFLDMELNVLGEDRRDKRSGRWKGLSRNYIPVLSEECADWVNREWRMRVTGIEPSGVTGRIVEKADG